jgi:hypothetical protein
MHFSLEDLEKKIHQTLRSLPDQPAPRSLEDRVFAALARQAALPWWRRSYLQWPLAIRIAFVVVDAAAFAALILVVRSGALAHLLSPVNQDFQWFGSLRLAGAGLLQAGVDATRSIPSLWLYATLATVAACYATLVGVGAAAYRAFSPSR